MNELSIFDTDELSSYSKKEITEFIFKVEELSKKGEPVELPLRHHFSKDVYAREMFMPKGCLIVGKIHKHENLNILSAGEVTVISIDGVKRIKAPYTFVGSVGAKRIIFAHDDVIWTTIHGTNKTDLSEIEKEFITNDINEIGGLKWHG
ncbi:MAG: hypothetical protein ACK41T_00690 [Pseudobdellovibrio sp.]